MDHVLRLVRKGKPLDHIPKSEPLLIPRLFKQIVERIPALGRYFKWAYVGFTAVRFVARHRCPVLVVNLQEIRIRYLESGSARSIMCDVCFVHVLDQRQPARHSASCVDDTYPIGAWLSIERPFIVINAVRQELE